jgi:MEMO1 family protein
MKKLLILLGSTLLLLSACAAEEGPLDIYSMYSGDDRMWERIFSEEDPYQFESAPLGVIIPHHMITEMEISRFYKGLSEVMDPSLVVIIGPNHYESGEANIQTCLSCVYNTIEGVVNLDLDFAAALSESGLVEENDEAFFQEHAFFSHTPFVKHYFSDAKVVPIMLNWEMPIEEVEELTQWLDENLPEDSLVIASVDFSHYIPDSAAKFHDQFSYTTIQNFDSEAVYELEVDSPSSVYAILDLMHKRGYMQAERLAHTTLGQYMSYPVEESTSHQYFAFYEGEVEEMDGESMMLFGRSEGLEEMESWDWLENKDKYPELSEIRGLEDRFLVGGGKLAFGFVDSCIHETDICVGNGETFAFEFDGHSLTFESLGDFIVEGDSMGVVIGIHLADEYFELYFFPVEVMDGKPQLMEYEMRRGVFEKILSESSYPMESQIFEKDMMIRIETL